MNKALIFDDKIGFYGKNLPIIKRLIREAFFMALIQLFVISPSQAQKHPKKAVDQKPSIQFSDQEILKKSQISYRAEGGFTGVISYGVIISCSDGKISVLKSVYDPKLVNEDHKRYELGAMTHEKYLQLWRTLQKMNVFVTKDVPGPKEDILEEFTFSFNVKVGETSRQFQVFGINRPEASRLFAFKNVIDQSADMNSFWNSAEAVVKK